MLAVSTMNSTLVTAALTAVVANAAALATIAPKATPSAIVSATSVGPSTRARHRVRLAVPEPGPTGAALDAGPHTRSARRGGRQKSMAMSALDDVHKRQLLSRPCQPRA
jgi:hypothetical protein